MVPPASRIGNLAGSILARRLSNMWLIGDPSDGAQALQMDSVPAKSVGLEKLEALKAGSADFIVLDDSLGDGRKGWEKIRYE